MSRIDILRTKFVNPTTRRKVTVAYALSLPREHPAYREAKLIVARNSSQKKSAHKSRRQHAANVPTTTPLNDIETVYMDIVDSFIRSNNPKIKISKFAEQYMDGLSPIKIAAQYLKGFGVTEASQVDSVEILTSTWKGVPQFKVTINLTDGTYLEREFKRRKKRHEWIVYNSFFSSPQKHRGLAKQMLRSTLVIADELNVVAAPFHASLESGGYVWARMGGIPEQSERPQLLRHIKNRLDNIDTVLRTARRVHLDLIDNAKNDQSKREYQTNLNLLDTTIAALEKNPGVADMIDQIVTQELSNDSDWSGKRISPDIFTYIASTPIGKYLLLGTVWNGYFNLRKGSFGRQLLENIIAD
jgi:hypothetical protein